jgi:glycosyltransferase involved in cell wall biosynthesis
LVRYFTLIDTPHEYTYYYGFFSKTLVGYGHPVQRLRNQLPKAPWFRSMLRQTVFLASRLFHSEFDLYFEPNFIPVRIKAKKVVTTVHDFSFRRFPEAHPKDRIRYFEKNFSKNIRRADRIITDSFYIKNEAKELCGLPDEIITPIHLGVDHDVFRVYQSETLESCRRELGLPGKFILFVGTREPRKNLRRLVLAYAALPHAVQKEFSLVLVGPRGWDETDPLGERRPGNRVMVLDYLDTHKLALVYNLASALVYPSLYEGFGLPPIEAMACGCPVMVSNAGALPEVCGDAAIYVDPSDTGSIAGGIQRVLDDESVRTNLVERGLRRAKDFTWEKTARETLKVFAEVLDQR